MPAQVDDTDTGAQPARQVELVDDNNTTRNEDGPSPGITNGKGWDGKLRMPKSAVLSNPEALSDPDYSDEENVVPGDEIDADEGMHNSVNRALLPNIASTLSQRG